MPDGYIPRWKLLDAVSTPNLESFARCLTVNLLAESGCYSVLCSAPHKAEVRSTASLSAYADYGNWLKWLSVRAEVMSASEYFKL